MADKQTLLKLLGFGAAKQAGEKLSGRGIQLEEQLAEAEGTPKQKKKLSDTLGVKKD